MEVYWPKVGEELVAARCTGERSFSFWALLISLYRNTGEVKLAFGLLELNFVAYVGLNRLA